MRADHGRGGIIDRVQGLGGCWKSGAVLKANAANWVVISISQSAESAQNMQTALSGEGFLVNIRQAGGVAGEHVYEILAIPSEANEARDFLNEIRG
jgi:hypothetical protein